MSTYLTWIFLAAALAAALGLISMKRAERVRRRAADRARYEEAAARADAGPERPAEAPFQETHLDRVALRSALPDYDFLFSASVWWRPATTAGDAPTHGSLSGLAAATVLRRAQELTLHEPPDRYGSVQYRLEEQLGSHALDDSATLVVMVTDVTLTLAAEDGERLRKLAGLRKEEGTWEQERQYERSKRKYLADEILKTPGSAAVWWLARHEDDVEGTVNLLGPLAQLSAASNDTEVAELFRHLVEGPSDAGSAPWDDDSLPRDHPQDLPLSTVDCVARLLDAAGLEDPSPERWTLLHRIIRGLEGAGRRGEAEEVRSHLWPDQTPEESAPEDPADEPPAAGSEPPHWEPDPASS
ncbi:hypothetical protein [Streptomyces sp. NPDC058157]|uniref:hypothetical protein n=1 Tax=Streptomyces sp. NPDC058157 TaxID=3346360 RepID=UPI0036E69C5C